MKQMTSADFVPLVNQKFKVTIAEADPEDGIQAVETELELSGVKETGNDTCEGFSLIFLGNADKVLPQRTYKVHNDTLGDREIFIVPIAPDDEDKQPAGRQRYQALFNRIRPEAEAQYPPPQAPQGDG